MSRYFGAFALAALVVMAAAGVGPSQDGKKDKANDGVVADWSKSPAFEPGKFTAFWVWHENDVWYFRTTGGDKKSHRFAGVIEVVGGRLVDLKGKKGEYGGKHVDRYVFSPTAIAFDFATDDGVDGLNFAVDPAATGLKFTVAIDGQASPKHIRIGKAGDHPPAAVFTVPAHPRDMKKK